MQTIKLLGSLGCLLLIMACAEQQPAKTEEPVSPQKKEVIVPEEKPPAPIVYDLDTTEWMDILWLDSTILLDIRYATSNNFVKEQMYECPRCLLRPEVARRIMRAHHILQKQQKGIKVFDCYRPRPVQQKLWEKVPNASYVTPPSKGSMHNRGGAVDLTIVDKEGNELDMGTAYDFFGKEAHHDYLEHDSLILANRQLLKRLMGRLNLQPIRTEWWHYSYRGESYAISDMLWKCD